MKTILLIVAAIVCLTPISGAQDYVTRNGGSVGDRRDSSARHEPRDILVNGKYYYAARLERFTPYHAVAVHRDGSTKVAWKDLDPMVQHEYAAEHDAAVATGAKKP